MHESHRCSTVVGACDPKVAARCPFKRCSHCHAEEGTDKALAPCPNLGDPWNDYGHLWEDVSYHGSPIYDCRLCDARFSDAKAYKPCPGRAAHDEKVRRDTEAAERAELKALQEADARRKYLETKYET